MSSSTEVSEDFYDSDNSDDEDIVKKGPQRKLKPTQEYFIIMCRLRRGFSEHYLANLYAVGQFTISRILISSLNYMYLKFGQICIWPSKSVVIATVLDDFKDKFPNTPVITDCTEVFCEMPNILQLNLELFSSYKDHVTLKGLVGIAPSGAITFVSRLYTGSISDREIVESGFLSQQYDDNDSIMADKGFTIEDKLPLGVSLNIPAFLGSNEQMSSEDFSDSVSNSDHYQLKDTCREGYQQDKELAYLARIVPLNNFGVLNQMQSICAFLCNLQEPLISI